MKLFNFPKKSNSKFLQLLALSTLFFILVVSLFQTEPLTEGALSSRSLKRYLSNKSFTLINVDSVYKEEIEKTDAFIEYDQMMASKKMLPGDLEKPIVLYDQTGGLSAQSYETLKGMGYKKVSYLSGGMNSWKVLGYKTMDLSSLGEDVTPTSGHELPISLGDLGPKLVELGVINLPKFKEVVRMTPEELEVLTKGTDKNIKIDAKNGQYVVDVLWALGLAQKSLVYDEGPLGKEYKDKVGNFASTGGWNLAKGDATNYLNKYNLIPLTSEQHKLVGEIAKNIYRPCCGNPTWFPDCNHGMAMLAAIELMVYKAIPEGDIYKHALALNSYWFPQNYLTVAAYYARQGISWDQVDAKVVLGKDYSSSKGAADVAKKAGPLPGGVNRGGSCGS